MSILIKDMKMPSAGHVMGVLLYPNGDAYILSDEIPVKRCKAVELPSHGRLIDADKLHMSKFHPLPYTHITPSDVNAESYKRGWNDAIDAIVEDEPTIIEAELKPMEWIKCEESER